MEIITDAIRTVSGWMAPHLDQIGVAVMATLLVIYGAEVNTAVKKKVASWPFALRLAVFVALCAAGYGTIMILAAPLVADIFRQLDHIYLAPVVIFVFLLIGLAAERRNQM